MTHSATFYLSHTFCRSPVFFFFLFSLSIFSFSFAVLQTKMADNNESTEMPVLLAGYIFHSDRLMKFFYSYKFII